MTISLNGGHPCIISDLKGPVSKPPSVKYNTCCRFLAYRFHGVKEVPFYSEFAGFYYKQVLVLHVLILIICKNGHLVGFVRAA